MEALKQPQKTSQQQPTQKNVLLYAAKKVLPVDPNFYPIGCSALKISISVTI